MITQKQTVSLLNAENLSLVAELPHSLELVAKDILMGAIFIGNNVLSWSKNKMFLWKLDSLKIVQKFISDATIIDISKIPECKKNAFAVLLNFKTAKIHFYLIESEKRLSKIFEKQFSQKASEFNNNKLIIKRSEENICDFLFLSNSVTLIKTCVDIEEKFDI
ncbi:hypothetical protein MHBO_001057 [Bonamia ostreae]|uniref:Uncharacterized protein n=1 Tax=Bonamia ostreae TaxID=126728 RepID=A0ABV2AI70_9EUKA